MQFDRKPLKTITAGFDQKSGHGLGRAVFLCAMVAVRETAAEEHRVLDAGDRARDTFPESHRGEHVPDFCGGGGGGGEKITLPPN